MNMRIPTIHQLEQQAKAKGTREDFLNVLSLVALAILTIGIVLALWPNLLDSLSPTSYVVQVSSWWGPLFTP